MERKLVRIDVHGEHLQRAECAAELDGGRPKPAHADDGGGTHEARSDAWKSTIC